MIISYGQSYSKAKFNNWYNLGQLYQPANLLSFIDVQNDIFIHIFFGFILIQSVKYIL